VSAKLLRDPGGTEPYLGVSMTFLLTEAPEELILYARTRIRDCIQYNRPCDVCCGPDGQRGRGADVSTSNPNTPRAGPIVTPNWQNVRDGKCHPVVEMLCYGPGGCNMDICGDASHHPVAKRYALYGCCCTHGLRYAVI
jgi:hypothetical protein